MSDNKELTEVYTKLTSICKEVQQLIELLKPLAVKPDFTKCKECDYSRTTKTGFLECWHDMPDTINNCVAGGCGEFCVTRKVL